VSDQEQTATAPRRVVVAEDESLIRMDIVEILRDNGFDVVGEAATARPRSPWLRSCGPTSS